MIINPVQDEDIGKTKDCYHATGENSFEFQTANDLFEIMAKNHPYDINGTPAQKSLSTQDLVILYENMDIGTKLISAASNKITSNQYVETVVYNDDLESEGSDVSDIYCKEDLRDICMINNERLNILNNISSFDNSICHKFGNIKLKPSDLVTDYDKHFLFKDPYIKEQLKNINIISGNNEISSSMIPASLLDYICCKRLEDNYNFYMDNVIRYVQHTIDQLKRISNGDYLTDRAKEKWQESNNFKKEDNKNIVLANSVSIPIHIQGKKYYKSTWDDMVHSEMDVRSLSRLLEKKIILEVPKLISGSYKLFSEHCNESLIIKCKNNEVNLKSKDKLDSTSNVVIAIKHSITKDDNKNINSIVILKTITPNEQAACMESQLALSYENVETPKLNPQVQIVELNEDDISENKNDSAESDSEIYHTEVNLDEYQVTGTKRVNKSLNTKHQMKEIYPVDYTPNRTEANYNLFTPDELRSTVQRLSMQSPVLEENEELCTKNKRSPTRVRIKSPYENKSFLMEEKKRKKLLEIREKRERRKLAMTENSKVTKPKNKGAFMPQASSSVTKLSITNKSFYSSIYGQKQNMESKNLKKSIKKLKKDSITGKDVNEEHPTFSPLVAVENNANDTFYGDTDAEITYMQIKQESDDDEPKCNITSTSNALNDLSTNLTMMQQLTSISVTDLSGTDGSSSVNQSILYDYVFDNSDKVEDNDFTTPNDENTQNEVPASVPKSESLNKKTKLLAHSVECKKSIDKLYDLMKQLGKSDNVEVNSHKNRYTSISPDQMDVQKFDNSVIHHSDSGSSIKYPLNSSSPSSLSFAKATSQAHVPKKVHNKKPQSSVTVPKVVISTKLQTVKFDESNLKKDHKHSDSKMVDNPLKAISQLLHKFDNVQKTRYEKPINKKNDIHTASDKSGQRQFNPKRFPRHDQNSKENEPNRFLTPRDKKFRRSPTNPVKPPNIQVPIEDKPVEKINKKKLAEIMDEVKELRGEAVRGPKQSRLNSLAQPKKSYVQAHSEEYQGRYGRSVVSDRLQRLAHTNSLPEKNAGLTNFKIKQRKVPEVINTKQQHLPTPPLEKIANSRRSASNSPKRKCSPQSRNESPMKMSNVAEFVTPETLKKMVAVESYVKNHYGRQPMTHEFSEPHSVHRSRVPVVPTDIDICSTASSPLAEESTSLGNKLHHMIDSMINTTLPTLNNVAERKESVIKPNKSDIDKKVESNTNFEEVLSGSDFLLDIFEDKNIITAISSISDCKISKGITSGTEDNQNTKTDVKTTGSTTEMEKLENAIYRQMTGGAFQKKLRIKNLTLTPKNSMQQVLVLQSGDTGSLVVRTTVSQKFHTSMVNDMSELQAVPVLSKGHIDLSFANFPVQVATVGYSFPTFQIPECESISKTQSLFNQKSTNSSLKSTKDPKQFRKISSKIIQCFRGKDTDHTVDNTISTNSIKYIKEFNSNNKRTLTKKCKSIECENGSHGIKSERITTEQRELDSTMISKSCDSNDHYRHTFLDMIKNTNNESEIIPAQSEKNTNNESKIIPAQSENIDNTTSLDILVGLLNEIRKITMSSANMSNDNNLMDDSKKLQTILNHAAAREISFDNNPQDLVSITSLDKFRQLESNPSIYSFYISSNEGDGESNIRMTEAMYSLESKMSNLKPLSMDKEVNVNFFDKEFVHTFTDVQSLLSIAVKRNSNEEDSVMDQISQSSSQTMFSETDYQVLYSNNSFNTVELNILREKSVKSPINDVTVQNSITLDENAQKLSDNSEKATNGPNSVYGIPCRTKEKKKVCRFKDYNVDPLLKFKRDILVTIYSILVITVFAALSFPEIYNRV